MADCPYAASCSSFFEAEMAGKQPLAEVHKNRWCRRDNHGCARFIAIQVLGQAAVPGDLYPYQVVRAEDLVSADPVGSI